MDLIDIIAYENRFLADFKNMNLEWLDQFGLTESHDLQVLADPQQTIIIPGGFIFLAKENGVPVGSAALMKTGKYTFELAKMTVRPQWQGRGISKLLIEKCIWQAVQSGAEKIFLFSNHQLIKALQLYTGYGFRHVPVVDSPFNTADVRMELDLKDYHADKKTIWVK
jgi:putative acetyltransferase